MAFRNLGLFARYGLPGAALGAAMVWAVGGGQPPTASAQQNQPLSHPGLPTIPRMSNESTGSANGTIAFLVNDGYGSSQSRLVLIDSVKKSFAVYRFEQKPELRIKLEAARQYRSDMDLAEFNNLAPSVSAIETMTRTNANNRNNN